MDALKIIAQDNIKAEVPKFNIGDTVKVSVNIREGQRERIQNFEGTVIAKRGSGISETFTVRRVSYGVGIERVFPIHSPNVVDVKVIRAGKVRRAKLYYLRDRVGKAAKVKEAIKYELDDVAFKSPTIDKNRRIVTYRKILEALIRKDNFCNGLYDELIRMHKQYMDYKKFHKK